VRLTEAFCWAQTRMVSSTATVSLLGNRYQVDASLVGRRVELRFVPEDMTLVSVYFEGKPMGAAVPFVISAHTHPQVAKPATTPAPPTGIDYLGMVLAASEGAAAGRIDYRLLQRGGGATDNQTSPDEKTGGAE
jgi:putative transposase